jgi:ubiquinone/menaquinone biosynthesis C-methylase UbiE
MHPLGRLLGDAPNRSYAGKLERFEAFAAPELRRVFEDLDLPARGTALDLGCGTGFATHLLAEQAGPAVTVVGLDLSWPHLRAARRQHALPLIQGDAARLCFRDAAFDFIWSCNVINHLEDPVASLGALRRPLRIGGQLVVAQSAFLPEMFFAWDAPLDDAVRAACHRYYRERYGLHVADTASVRGVIGLMRAAGFDDVVPRTYVLERAQPLSQVDRRYFQEAVFDGVWGERIGPYLDAEQREKLRRNCDPTSPDYCLNRADFHHVQTLTVCTGRRVAERSEGGKE